MFGDLGLALASVALVAMTPVLNVLCVSVLVRYASPGAPDWRDVLSGVVQNPLIWACAVGIALNPFSGSIPQPLFVFVDALGRSSLALGLLIVGAGLRLAELARPNAVVLITCALKLVVMPAVAIAARAYGRPRRRRPAGHGVLRGGAGGVEFLHPGAPDGRRRAADGSDPHLRNGARGDHHPERDRAWCHENGRASARPPCISRSHAWSATGVALRAIPTLSVAAAAIVTIAPVAGGRAGLRIIVIVAGDRAPHRRSPAHSVARLVVAVRPRRDRGADQRARRNTGGDADARAPA